MAARQRSRGRPVRFWLSASSSPNHCRSFLQSAVRANADL